MNQESSEIQCPHCGEEIDVNKALSRQLKEELRDELELEAEKKLNKKLRVAKEEFRKTEQTQFELKLPAQEKIVSDLKRRLQDAQRKAEQGSQQLQGEVQELAIEEWLTEQFPQDTIEEIKKGQRGANGRLKSMPQSMSPVAHGG